MSEVKTCRICLGEDDGGEYLQPCKCRGSQLWVHRTCIDTWFRSASNFSPGVCPTCGHRYNHIGSWRPWEPLAVFKSISSAEWLCFILAMVIIWSPSVRHRSDQGFWDEQSREFDAVRKLVDDVAKWQADTLRQLDQYRQIHRQWQDKRQRRLDLWSACLVNATGPDPPHMLFEVIELASTGHAFGPGPCPCPANSSPRVLGALDRCRWTLR
jgi:hypothetical protein